MSVVSVQTVWGVYDNRGNFASSQRTTHNTHTPVCMNTLTVLTTQSMFGQLSLSSDWLVSVKPDTL